MEPKRRGRPPGKTTALPTIQIRVDEETAAAVKKLAAVAGSSTPEFLHEWLLPLAKSELARRLMADLADLKAGEKGKPAK